MNSTLVDEFELDWHLSRKSKETAKKYARDIKKFLASHPKPTLIDAKQWILGATSVVSRRKRGQALRAFGKWLSDQGIDELSWAQKIPLAKEKSLPQTTATHADYINVLNRLTNLRDRAVIET